MANEDRVMKEMPLFRRNESNELLEWDKDYSMWQPVSPHDHRVKSGKFDSYRDDDLVRADGSRWVPVNPDRNPNLPSKNEDWGSHPLHAQACADVSRQISVSARYAWPNGFWTLEVFHNDCVLIPEAKVECLQEPSLEDNRQHLNSLLTKETYIYQGRQTWRPVTVSYLVTGDPDDVGTMLMNNHEELCMVPPCKAELTYWLNQNSLDRRWVINDWLPVNFDFSMPDMKWSSPFHKFNLTFRFSEATLTTYH